MWQIDGVMGSKALSIKEKKSNHAFGGNERKEGGKRSRQEDIVCNVEVMTTKKRRYEAWERVRHRLMAPSSGGRRGGGGQLESLLGYAEGNEGGRQKKTFTIRKRKSDVSGVISEANPGSFRKGRLQDLETFAKVLRLPL